jgi:hypothetical protein
VACRLEDGLEIELSLGELPGVVQEKPIEEVEQESL